MHDPPWCTPAPLCRRRPPALEGTRGISAAGAPSAAVPKHQHSPHIAAAGAQSGRKPRPWAELRSILALVLPSSKCSLRPIKLQQPGIALWATAI